MTRLTKHAKILPFPLANTVQNARLDALSNISVGKRHDLIMDYRELEMLVPPILSELNGQPQERIEGQYIPRRLRFSDVTDVDCTGLFTQRDLNDETDVFNGIAYDPNDSRLFVTGKHWPKLFEIKLIPPK